MHPTAASQTDTVPALAYAAAATDLFSTAEDAKAQTVEDRECSITDHSDMDTPQSSSQASAEDDAVDYLLLSPTQYSLNTVNSLPAAASLSAYPAAPLVAQLDQLADLQSHLIDADQEWGKPQYQCASESPADKAVHLSAPAHNAEDVQSTSSNHEQLTYPQTAWSGSLSAADSHTHPGSRSESDSEGESDAAAAEVSVEQSCWLPPQFFRWQDPTGRHNDLGLSSDYPPKQDSEGGPGT